MTPLHPFNSRSSHNLLKSLKCGEFQPGGRLKRQIFLFSFPNTNHTNAKKSKKNVTFSAFVGHFNPRKTDV